MHKRDWWRNQKLLEVAVVLLIAICGTVVLQLSKAATPTVALEAELGTLSGSALNIMDAAASGGKAIIFGTMPSIGQIPDTNYPVPAGAIFMSPSGNDANSGIQAAPVKSVTRALALVPAGGTVVVRGGVYRDGSGASIFKAVTFQAYPHEQAWFDGSDVVSNWTASGSQWAVGWSTPAFCGGHYYDVGFRAQGANGPCAYYDQYNDTTNPMSADPLMVFIDGVYIQEVSTAAEAVGNNFYYDQAARRIILGTNPSGHTVEVTARASALVFQGGAGPAKVLGLGFRKYASNNYAANVTSGAILLNVPGGRFENNYFTQNAGAGLKMADPSNAVVRNNVFYKNGGNGISGNGHQGNGTIDNTVIDNNLFDANNFEKFGAGCNYACQAAGIKLNHMNGFTLKNNIFQNQVGVAHGFWCDLACTRGVMTGNVVRNNGGTGIYYEVSDTGIIASNLVYGNKEYGIKSGSANTKIYNNSLFGNRVGMLIYDDTRSYGVGGWTDVGPDSVNVEIVNNIISSSQSVSIQSWRTSTAAPNTGPNTFYKAYNFNSYFRPGTAPAIAEWRDGTSASYSTLAGLTTAHGWEGSGHDITSGTEPYFVNAAGGDFHIRAGSRADNSGTPLPADVAAAIGVAAGQAVDRGALLWVGQ